MAGPGAKFLGASLSVTGEPMQSDSEICLPWLKEWELWQVDRNDHRQPLPGPTDNDPIFRETNDRSIELFWPGYFLYRSSY